MRWYFLALFGSMTAAAADPQMLALERRAQADFDRVEKSSSVQLADSEACIQSQVAWLAVAPPATTGQAHYRKAYCLLAEAAISRNSGTFQQAAAEFDKAGGPALLVALARIETNTGDEAALRRAVAQPDCRCDAAVETAREWLGRLELDRNNLVGAEREFAATSSTGWQKYIAGRQAYDRRLYREAAADYRAAVDFWDREGRQPATGTFERLRPPADTSAALIGLGGAQILAGDAAAAIITLDRAVKADASAPRAYYLRARAHEVTGQTDSALADYNLASRAAFASARDLASGEAHLYRGILLYLRQNFAGAENEFSSSLNFNITPDLQADAVAWRHLAAVAAGGCEASRQALARALGTVSPYFPSDEAERRMDACPTD